MVLLVIGMGVVAVAGLTGVLLRSRAARKRQSAAAADAMPHPHYCPECDQEWPHVGRTCLKSWALLCPKCGGVPAAAADVPARPSAA
jgi:ribosomal protein L37AE/L43A